MRARDKRGIVEKLKVDKRTWRLGEQETKRVAKKLKNPLNKKTAQQDQLSGF